MGEIGGIAFWLMVFSGLVLVAAILTPLIEKVLLNFNFRFTTAGDKDRVRKIAQHGQLFTQPNRSPDKYRDPQLDELILAGRLDEAGSLAAERLRLACERGQDERMEFYRDYERRIEAARLHK